MRDSVSLVSEHRLPSIEFNSSSSRVKPRIKVSNICGRDYEEFDVWLIHNLGLCVSFSSYPQYSDSCWVYLETEWGVLIRQWASDWVRTFISTRIIVIQNRGPRQGRLILLITTYGQPIILDGYKIILTMPDVYCSYASLPASLSPSWTNIRTVQDPSRAGGGG